MVSTFFFRIPSVGKRYSVLGLQDTRFHFHEITGVNLNRWPMKYAHSEEAALIREHQDNTASRGVKGVSPGTARFQ